MSNPRTAQPLNSARNDLDNFLKRFAINYDIGSITPIRRWNRYQWLSHVLKARPEIRDAEEGEWICSFIEARREEIEDAFITKFNRRAVHVEKSDFPVACTLRTFGVFNVFVEGGFVKKVHFCNDVYVCARRNDNGLPLEIGWLTMKDPFDGSTNQPPGYINIAPIGSLSCKDDEVVPGVSPQFRHFLKYFVLHPNDPDVDVEPVESWTRGMWLQCLKKRYKIIGRPDAPQTLRVVLIFADEEEIRAGFGEGLVEEKYYRDVMIDPKNPNEAEVAGPLKYWSRTPFPRIFVCDVFKWEVMGVEEYGGLKVLANLTGDNLPRSILAVSDNSSNWNGNAVQVHPASTLRRLLVPYWDPRFITFLNKHVLDLEEARECHRWSQSQWRNFLAKRCRRAGGDIRKEESIPLIGVEDKNVIINGFQGREAYQGWSWCNLNLPYYLCDLFRGYVSQVYTPNTNAPWSLLASVIPPTNGRPAFPYAIMTLTDDPSVTGNYLHVHRGRTLPRFPILTEQEAKFLDSYVIDPTYEEEAGCDEWGLKEWDGFMKRRFSQVVDSKVLIVATCDDIRAGFRMRLVQHRGTGGYWSNRKFRVYTVEGNGDAVRKVRKSREGRLYILVHLIQNQDAGNPFPEEILYFGPSRPETGDIPWAENFTSVILPSIEFDEFVTRHVLDPTIPGNERHGDWGQDRWEEFLRSAMNSEFKDEQLFHDVIITTRKELEKAFKGKMVKESISGLWSNRKFEVYRISILKKHLITVHFCADVYIIAKINPAFLPTKILGCRRTRTAKGQGKPFIATGTHCVLWWSMFFGRFLKRHVLDPGLYTGMEESIGRITEYVRVFYNIADPLLTDHKTWDLRRWNSFYQEIRMITKPGLSTTPRRTLHTILVATASEVREAFTGRDCETYVHAAPRTGIQTSKRSANPPLSGPPGSKKPSNAFNPQMSTPGNQILQQSTATSSMELSTTHYKWSKIPFVTYMLMLDYNNSVTHVYFCEKKKLYICADVGDSDLPKHIAFTNSQIFTSGMAPAPDLSAICDHQIS